MEEKKNKRKLFWTIFDMFVILLVVGLFVVTTIQFCYVDPAIYDDFKPIETID